MSYQFEALQSPIKKEIVEEIEKLNLSTVEKLHLKLLVHCLEIFKNITLKSDKELPNEEMLMDWCKEESLKLNDKNFANLLFEQMDAVANKLEEYAIKLDKKTLDLTLNDLISLVSQK